jgi:hypothetical protein
MPKTFLPIEPIEIEPGNFHLFLTVKIGVKKARLLLDTGASRTAFDLHRFENFAHRNKQDHQEINSVGLGSNEVKTHLAQINTLKLGEIKHKGLLAAVLDLAHVNQAYELLQLPPIDGVMGSDILMQYLATINLKKMELSLHYSA